MKDYNIMNKLIIVLLNPVKNLYLHLNTEELKDNSISVNYI